jgi:hypothetical protein
MTQTMSDQLYLSLWYPNFRLESLPGALTGVLRQFATVAGEGKPGSLFGRVWAASAYPIDWTESPTYQRVFVNDTRSEDSGDTDDAIIENAIAEATEHLHEDMAYEFEMRWLLWQPTDKKSAESADNNDADLEDDLPSNVITMRPASQPAQTSRWKLEPARVRIAGFGPEFDVGAYDQNGHVRVEFGLDTPWVQEDAEMTREDAAKIQQNIEKLLAFTLLIEKHCGISSRLLWTESGEPLAEKLIARLQRLN